MTPAIASHLHYRFHCFCGARIAATEKTAACASCGRAFEIRRTGKRTHWRVTTSGHRRLRRGLLPSDLKAMAIRISLYLLLGYCAYELLDC
jgi:hypothetical protein